MSWIIAFERVATPDDERTWQILALEERPEFEIATVIEEGGLQWLVADIFRDQAA